MGEIGDSLIKWVNSTQLNTNDLNTKCNSLSQLSDGIIFYELLSTISQDYFDIDAISVDVKNTWALKLANLRRLKKTLDRYCEEEIKVKTSKFDKIDLPLIARTANSAEILKLFEYVMLVIVNCPQKTVFVKRIMDLEEYVQVQLMYFIQKVMGTDEEVEDENESQRREIDVLRGEKKKLAEKVNHLETEVSEVREELEKLQASHQQLQIEHERMEYELGKRVDNEEKESKAVEMDLRVRLGDKDDMIFDLKKVIEKNKKKYENEISQLKDDLDIANSKLDDAASNEKMIKQYKKRLESLSSVKQQNEELQKNCESLREKMAVQQGEYEGLVKIKSSYNNLKEQLEEERVKVKTLTFNLETRDKQLKKLEKSLEEHKERALFFQKKAEDLEAMDLAHDTSNISEDSYQADKNFLTVSKGKPTVDQLENMTNEFNRQKALVELKKTKTKRIKEAFKMFAEDFRSKMIEDEESLQQFKSTVELLQNDNYYLSEQIQQMTEQLKDKENQNFIHMQLVEELDTVKSAKIALAAEFKALQAEKDSLVKNVSDSSDKVLQHKSSISSKDTLLFECQTKLTQAQEQIKVLMETQELKTNTQVLGPAQDHKPKTEVFALRMKLAVAHAREEKLEDRVKLLMHEHEVTVSEWENKWKSFKENCEKELKKKDEDMIKQIEESTNELMKQRDQLVNKLQSEKRNSIMNFQKAMSVRELPLPMNKEVFRLREVVLEKEKEILKLKRGNKEITSCWKQTAKLLKAVSKELGSETVKIEEAVRERMSF